MTVTEDPAPWVDPYIPESTRFLGVMAQSQQGMDAGTPAMLGIPREFTITLLLVATDQLGLGYGLAWLAAALRSESCNSAPCEGLPVCVFNTCPTCDGGTCGDREQRTLYDVRVVDGPDVTTRYDLGGDTGCALVAATVEVTFRARVPYWYRMPVSLGTMTPAGEAITVPSPRPEAGTTPILCPDQPGCLTDPSCDLQPAVPALPPGSRDPCWLDDQYSAYRATLSVAPTSFPQWLSAVPIVEITPGTASLHWVQVSFFLVPSTGSGFDCATLRNRCTEACSVIAITFIPVGGVLTLDGRLPQAVTSCPGPVLLETTPVVGLDGGVVDWPVFSCGTKLCIEVLVKAEAGADDASVVVSLAVREDTI